MEETSLSRPPRWERRKESRPGELLAAALDVFVERGFAAARLEDVAARAGVSKGTLYLYYANKAELFKAVVRENIVPLIVAAREFVDRSDESAAQLLERFFAEWWQRFGATRLAGIGKLVIAESGNFPEVAHFFAHEVAAPDREILKSILERGIARGEFRPVDVDAAAECWIAPLVLKAIMQHSLDSVGPCVAPVEPTRLLASHLELVLAALNPLLRPATDGPVKPPCSGIAS